MPTRCLLALVSATSVLGRPKLVTKHDFMHKCAFSRPPPTVRARRAAADPRMSALRSGVVNPLSVWLSYLVISIMNTKNQQLQKLTLYIHSICINLNNYAVH